jgi:hypothetical protein
MTPEEARNVLGLPRNYTRKDIEVAYAQLCRKHVSRLNYATQPSERDVASRAAGILQQAYRKLTGDSPSAHLKVSAAAARNPGAIPRASLAGVSSGHAAAKTAPRPAIWTRPTPRAAGSVHTCNRPKPWDGWKEKVVCAVIYSAMCLIALFILSRGAGAGP